MWFLTFKKYAHSKLATFVSVVGVVNRYLGALCLIDWLVPSGLVMLVIGVGCHYLAEAISKKAVG